MSLDDGEDQELHVSSRVCCIILPTCRPMSTRTPCSCSLSWGSTPSTPLPPWRRVSFPQFFHLPACLPTCPAACLHPHAWPLLDAIGLSATALCLEEGKVIIHTTHKP